jgi:superfamily II DNA or RNA helicase
MASLDSILPADLRSETSTVIYSRGRELARTGAVRHLERSRTGLAALVSGARRNPYRVRVGARGAHDYSFACECGHFRATGSVCKHVVATLLAWIDQRDGVRRLGSGVPGAAGAPGAGSGGPATRGPYGMGTARGAHEREGARQPVANSPPTYRREVPYDPLEPILPDREFRLSPLRPGDLADAIRAPGDRWSWRVALDGRGPGLVLEGRAQLPGIDPGAPPLVTYRIPATHVPSMTAYLRGRTRVEWSPEAARVKVRRTPARLRLQVDEDGDTIALTPWVEFPGAPGSGGAASAADLHVGPDDVTWAVRDLAFYPVARKPGSAVEDVLAGRLWRRVPRHMVPIFLRDDLPRLAASPGVVVSDAVRASRVLAAPALESVRARAHGQEVDAGDTDVAAWFWLDPIYRAGPYQLTLEEILAKDGGPWIRRGRDWIPIDREALLDGLAPLRGDASDQGVRVARIGLLRARATWGDGVRIDRDAIVGTLLDRLSRSEPDAPPPAPASAGMKGRLRPYQETGYHWLWWLRESGFGGILADEMGLGKTHEVMALLVGVQAVTAGAARPRPTLVVCPRSVLDHWEAKVREFAPSLDPLVFHSAPRERNAARLREARVVLTTYGILSRSAELAEIAWEYVVLDEAQKIKNAATATARSVGRLRTRHQIALTGTPIENRPSELWSIMQFLVPGYLGSAEDFRRRFATPIAAGSVEAVDALRRAIRPFKLRRLKRDVLPELPPKVEDYRHCRLSHHQAAIYREILARRAAPLVERLRSSSARIDYVHIFAVLTMLKRLCDHPALVARGAAGRRMVSGKFEAFKELLHEILDAGEKVVVFSQYLEMLDIIEAHLVEKGIGFAGLRGKTLDRRAPLRRFHDDPNCRVFVGSLLAGGLGIDLTAASVVVHYDRWWNAAREDQATDRVHRIGQARGVQVWKLVTQGTIEDRIDRMIREKGALLEKIVEADEGTAMRSFTREELLELLAPVR